MAKRKKNKLKPITYTDEFGRVHIVVPTTPVRNMMHFDVQRNTKHNVVESKKHRKPKYKHKIFEEN